MIRYLFQYIIYHVNKNAKKSWRDGGIFAVLALLIYSFQVLSEYLVSAAIKALQVIKDDPSSFYRASTDKLESFFESANITLMVALFVALIINFVYRLSVSETPGERRGVLNGFLLGVGAVITATLAMTIEIIGIVGIFRHMQLLLGAMPAFFAVKALEKLFVWFSKGKIAKAREWVRKADTVSLFISLGAVLIVLALLLCACIGGGGGRWRRFRVCACVCVYHRLGVVFCNIRCDYRHVSYGMGDK